MAVNDDLVRLGAEAIAGHVNASFTDPETVEGDRRMRGCKPWIALADDYLGHSRAVLEAVMVT